MNTKMLRYEMSYWNTSALAKASTLVSTALSSESDRSSLFFWNIYLAVFFIISWVSPPTSQYILFLEFDIDFLFVSFGSSSSSFLAISSPASSFSDTEINIVKNVRQVFHIPACGKKRPAMFSWRQEPELVFLETFNLILVLQSLPRPHVTCPPLRLYTCTQLMLEKLLDAVLWHIIICQVKAFLSRYTHVIHTQLSPIVKRENSTSLTYSDMSALISAGRGAALARTSAALYWEHLWSS